MLEIFDSDDEMVVADATKLLTQSDKSQIDVIRQGSYVEMALIDCIFGTETVDKHMFKTFEAVLVHYTALFLATLLPKRGLQQSRRRLRRRQAMWCNTIRRGTPSQSLKLWPTVIT